MGCILVHTNYTDSSGEETASKTSSEPINIAFCAPIATLWPRNQPRSSRTSNARPQPPQTYIGGGIPGVALTEDQVDSPQFTGACAVGFQVLSSSSSFPSPSDKILIVSRWKIAVGKLFTRRERLAAST